MRQVAKSLVAADLCDYCEIQASYAIGITEPTSIYVNTFESEKKSIQEIEQVALENFDLTPYGIIQSLALLTLIIEKLHHMVILAGKIRGLLGKNKKTLNYTVNINT